MSKTLAGFTMILTAMLQTGCAKAQSEVNLPSGVKIVWDRDKAWHETTPTRERVCLNGLWCWQPGKADAEAVPAGSWGAFKVPGAWPGRGDYMMKDSMSVFRHD